MTINDKATTETEQKSNIMIVLMIIITTGKYCESNCFVNISNQKKNQEIDTHTHTHNIYTFGESRRIIIINDDEKHYDHHHHHHILCYIR